MPIILVASSRRVRAGFVVVLLFTSRVIGMDFHVSPMGSDQNPGSTALPFRTLARVQLASRQRSTIARATESVTAWIHAGSYELAEPLIFDARDSGQIERPTQFGAWPGEVVILSGGRRVPWEWFHPLSSNDPGWNQIPANSRAHVLVANLRPHKLDDFGSLRPRGFEQHALAPAELSYEGRPLILARWPNVDEPLARTAKVNGDTLTIEGGAHVQRWVGAKEIWVHGLWRENWADYHLPVRELGTGENDFSLKEGPAQFGLAENRPFYAYNLLEELDQPGEYYLDRNNGTLFLWPPLGFSASGRLTLSRLEEPLIQFADAEHVRLFGVTLEDARGGLLQISGGRDIRVDHCALLAPGGYAAEIAGEDNGLDHCLISDAGDEGVILRGGNRAKLVAGKNFIRNSIIRRAGRTSWTYKPAVILDGGCGNEISHNMLNDLPHSAILFKGDRHIIENNEISNVCRLTGDAGAIYGGHDWGYRGNVIQFNFIHDIASGSPGFGVHGVYLDDCLSGTLIRSNIFYEITHTAVFCGGGRDTEIEGNIIAFCGRAHFNDDRGIKRINHTPGDYWNLLERLTADGVDYQSPPRSLAFPKCAAIPNDWEQIKAGPWRNPEGCSFNGNYGWENNRWMDEDNSSATGVFARYRSISDNDSGGKPLFNQKQATDRSLRAKTLDTTLTGFTPIAWNEIGPNGPVGPQGLGETRVLPTARFEFEKGFTIVSDVGENGRIAVADGELDSGESVGLYDKGDAISVPFDVAVAGTFAVEVRVRCGGSTGKTVFWPGGYEVEVDGKRLVVRPILASVSELDHAYGGSYWGTLAGESILTAGKHILLIRAVTSWGVADYFQVTPH